MRPSIPCIKELSCKYLVSLDKFETKVMEGIDGLMFKGDASHKLTKLICLNTDEKVYHGLYTLMTFVRANNEFFLSTTDVYDEPLNQFNQINNSELATVG